QVIAPYASALALGVAPAEACDNLLRMRALAWSGTLGFYEAADYTAPTAEGAYQLVRSHMAHHQGMVLCALCNALTEDSLVAAFHSSPRVEAFELLLEERTPARQALHWRIRSTRRVDAPAKRPVRAVRHVHPQTIPLETQLLYGEGTTLLCDARGGGYIAHNGLMLTRWRPDPLADGYGLQCYVYDADSGMAWRAAQSGLPGETRFETGSAVFVRRQGEVHSALQCFVCPLDGAAIHLLSLHNRGGAPRTLSVATFFEVALSAQAADEAHPAFRNLFIQTARIEGQNAITAQRRPRAPQERYPILLHAAAADVPGLRWTAHTDRARFLGRDHGLLLPRALREGDAEGSVGAVVDPCMSLGTTVTVPPGESARFAFATAAAFGIEDAAQLAAQYADLGAAQRALELAQTQAQVAADYLSLDPGMQHQAQRLASYMLYRGQNTARAHLPPCACKREDLWACGLSGDLPILTLCAEEPAHLPLARSLFKIHEAWRQWGLWADLVLLDDHGGEYYPPTRSALQEMVASGHARDLVGKAGGVHFLDAQAIEPHRRNALIAHSSLVLHGGKGPLGAQMKAMRTGIPPIEQQANAQGLYPPPSYPVPAVRPLSRLLFNGWGGFARNGDYVIDLQPGKPTPAPWCNVLANPSFGAVCSERGAGFTFAHSSHGGRLTPWMNDPVRSRPGEALYLRDEETGHFAGLLSHAARVTHAPGFTRYEGHALGIEYRATVFVDAAAPLKHTLIQLRSIGDARELTVTAYASWALGDREDAPRMTRAHVAKGVCLAQSPNLPGCAFLAMPGETEVQTGLDRAGFLGLGGTLAPRGMYRHTLDSLGMDDACAVLRAPVRLMPGAEAEVHAALGWAESAEAALQAAENAAGQAPRRLAEVQALWEDRLSRLTVRTPDAALNVMLNRWLPYQLTASRLWARAGFYQAGGAFGFRDQLQDTLALLYTDPRAVRDHLLLCAAHQFESGDVQHWWHPPARGVRTRISDDLLFLPYVAAAYVRATGDASVLAEHIPYLRDADIPGGQEDWYGSAQESDVREPLLEHCLRAVRRVALGRRGIPLMGGGDWNDAMNRVGAEGRGESVWLGWFFAATLHSIAPLCGELQRDELLALRARLLASLEAHAWDGAWYRRAWFDDGTPLGCAGDPCCEIDCIAQCWAVLGGAIPERAGRAMESLWDRLIDREHGIVKLLAPPFDPSDPSASSDSPDSSSASGQSARNPGYIQGYLPGVRENGGQYTHGAAWAVLAFAELGQVERAWEVLRMLLPTAHTGAPERAARYRVEPYVSAADVYANPMQTGRGGWTWYTGSAAWLWIAGMHALLGFEKRGDALRLTPRIPKGWDSLSFAYRHGGSTYRISARRDVTHVTVDGRKQAEDWIALQDDGSTHEVVVPLPDLTQM
ncbi:MAG: glycosyl transferase family 36, partial [Clostridia bacterium]|nr:glycosyl transferase family 36 [Clostridia bacterium]